MSLAEACKAVDPDFEITNEEISQYSGNYNTYRSWYVGEAYKLTDAVSDIVTRIKGRRIVNELKVLDEKSWAAGRCYRKGWIKYARPDGGPLTDQQLVALNTLSLGQYTKTTAKVGDQVAVVNWACDSGD